MPEENEPGGASEGGEESNLPNPDKHCRARSPGPMARAA